MNPSTTHSMYYLAILCPDELNKKIQLFKLWMQEKFGCKVALKSPAYITLIPPFWLDIAKEDVLLQAILNFDSSQHPITVGLNGFAHFSNRVIFIDIKPNNHLVRVRQEAMDHFINKLGGIIKNETRPFIPHITIANRDLNPGDFLKAWQHFSGKKFEENFTTSELSLLKLSLEKWNVILVKYWAKP